MKPMVRLLVLGGALALALSVSAFAADFTHCADALNDLGLFRGTELGYELDRAPSRAEAGVMLVRLLGAEEEALAAEDYTAPFTDVPNWAKPYVQYLYDKGLSNGESAVLYGAENPCTAQQYAAFLLRALGYSDAEGGDFTYAGAMDFARELGVVDMANCDEDNFLRDDVVAMSYTALSVAPKSGETDLLAKLTAEGAVDGRTEAAEETARLFADYRAYLAAGAQSQADAVSMSMEMAADMTAAGAPYLTYSMELDVAAEVDLEQMDGTRMAMTGTVEMTLDPAVAAQLGLTAEEASSAGELAYYYADGYYYISMDGQKLKLPMSLEEIMDQMGGLTAAAVPQADPICLVRDLTVTRSGREDTYAITYAGGAMSGLVQSVMGMMPEEMAGAAPAAMALGDVAVSVTVRNGALTAMELSMAMETEAEGVPVALTMEMTAADIRTEGVTVVLPDDLDTYQEIALPQA